MRDQRPDGRTLRHVISTPFIWGMLFPLVVLDITMEIYHRICFPLYGLPLVRRQDYIRLDRYKLPYLSPMEKFNCLYCEYANGLINYAQRIAGDTEGYWCAITHKKYAGFVAPSHHAGFAKYGDKNAYERAKRRQAKG